jgi:hypothetical protein
MPFKPLQGKGSTYAYNGYADTMAPQATNWQPPGQKGASEVLYGPEPFLPLSAAAVKATVQQEFQVLWVQTWHQNNNSRPTKIFFAEPNKATSRQILSLNRRDLGLFIQHSTGFSYLNYHQSLIQPGILNPGICRLCGQAREESQHITHTHSASHHSDVVPVATYIDR